MTVTNYFRLRWADGFSHVSAAAPDVVVALEQLAAVTSVSSDHVTLTVSLARLGDRAVPVGMIRLDVRVSSSPRRLQYTHAVVLPARARAMTSDAWHRVVVRRYGDDIEERIRSLYEELAVTTKADGRGRLAALEITDHDVEAELAAIPAQPEVAEPPPATEPADLSPEPAPRPGPKPPAGVPLRVAVGLAVAVAALAAVVIVLLARGAPAGAADPGELNAARDRATAAEARVVAAEAERDAQRAEADKQRRKAQNCGLTCDTINDKLVEAQARLAVVEPKLTRLEPRLRELESAIKTANAERDLWKRRVEQVERSLADERSAHARTLRDKQHAEAARDKAEGDARRYRSLRHTVRNMCRRLDHNDFPECRMVP